MLIISYAKEEAYENPLVFVVQWNLDLYHSTPATHIFQNDAVLRHYVTMLLSTCFEIWPKKSKFDDLV